MKKLLLMCILLLLVISHNASATGNFPYDTFDYSLGMPCIQEIEGNDSAETAQEINELQLIIGAIQLSESIYGNASNLYGYLDRDYYKFTLTEKHCVYIRVTGSLIEDNLKVAIHDSYGNDIFRSTSSKKDDGYYTVETSGILTAGTYTFSVYNTAQGTQYNNEAYICCYSTDMPNFMYDQAQALYNTFPDATNYTNVPERESNNFIESAQPIQHAQAIQGSIHLSGANHSIEYLSQNAYKDVDHYKFILTNRSCVRCFLVGEIKDDHLVIMIKDQFDNVLCFSDSELCEDGNFAARAIRVLDAGTYFFTIITAVGNMKYDFEKYICYFDAISMETESVSGSINSTISVPAPSIPYPLTPQFQDVADNAYYSEAVKWAVEHGITNGTTATTFSPHDTCTKSQIITFLWRAWDSPDSIIDNPFTDIAKGTYYYKAALWAYETGLVSGSTFKGDTPCTRAATVSYLWKLNGSPPAPSDLPFHDISPSDISAVSWALRNGITSGTTETTFSPDDICTRGQIVTFLYRAFVL